MNKLTKFGTSPLLIVAGSLLVAAVAVAAITNGTSTTSQSTDITYTQLALSKPADAVAGDILLASVSVKDGSTSTITAPTGWVLINRTDNSTNVGLAIYYRVADVSEPNSYNWNISPTTHAVGGITRYSGVDTNNPIDIITSTTGHSLTPTAPSVTTTGNGERVVAIYTARGGDNTQHFATSSGMSKLYDTGYNPGGPSVMLQDKTQTTAGATGSFASTIPPNIGRDWVAVTIALRSVPTASVLIVGGGGGGGSGNASGGGNGGGGAGAVLASTVNISPASYPIIVGDGGAAGSAGLHGSNGGDSSAFAITALGGGGGGGVSLEGGSDTAEHGLDGGSGGGAGAQNSPQPGGFGATGGHNGGSTFGIPSNGSAGGGGGGAGAAGADGGNVGNGNGGDGITSTISGASVMYGGGGGTVQFNSGGSGGAGGGGHGGNAGGTGVTAGGTNLGGGGGGGTYAGGGVPGAAGGSGIVIISYPTGSITATGGTITTVGGNTIHTFTSSGTFTVTAIN